MKVKKPERIPHIWERAVVALLSTPHFCDAVEPSGVPERTLRRWLTLPNFQALLVKRATALFGTAIAKLQSGADAAISRLHKEMDSDTPNPFRVKAAEVLLEQAFRANGLTGLADRMAALEAALANQGSSNAAPGLLERLQARQSVPAVNGNGHANGHGGNGSTNGNGKH